MKNSKQLKLIKQITALGIDPDTVSIDSESDLEFGYADVCSSGLKTNVNQCAGLPLDWNENSEPLDFTMNHYDICTFLYGDES